MINNLLKNTVKQMTPIVVGLDPMLNYIPQHIQKKAFSELGGNIRGSSRSYLAV